MTVSVFGAGASSLFVSRSAGCGLGGFAASTCGSVGGCSAVAFRSFVPPAAAGIAA